MWSWVGKDKLKLNFHLENIIKGSSMTGMIKIVASKVVWGEE